jgi:hydroxymethylbilane synthase
VNESSIIIATRGSALALAQANIVLADCRQKFPRGSFELKIITTSGDKLQTASLSRIDASLPRGLFTKELEAALLEHAADLAVHSLKDLPTDLPAGLTLAAVAGKRADVRDVLIYRAAGGAARGFDAGMGLADFPGGTTIATSSTRRQAQLLAARPDFKAVEIRGNVPTRLQKLAQQPGIDATVLAAAGLHRLNIRIDSTGDLRGAAAPEGLRAVLLDLDVALPCVGQGALGLETRQGDERIEKICRLLNHAETFQCVTAERAFLRSMGGGCQAPVGAYAWVENDELRLRVISFLTVPPRRASGSGPTNDPVGLGEKMAAQLK